VVVVAALSRRGLIRAAAATAALGTLRLGPFGLAEAAPYPNDGSPLGTNLAGVFDWTSQWPFVDIFKISRPWISNRVGQPWGQGGPLNLTSEGWVRSLEPGQRADTVMYSLRTSHPTGQYVCLFDGHGQLAFPGQRVVSQAPGRIVVEVAGRTDEIWLQLLATDPAYPIRNIRLVMPGFEATYRNHPFHPLFLERIGRFRQLRFMDWQRTNQTSLVNWADRATCAS
jgi:hypothetical protein